MLNDNATDHRAQAQGRRTRHIALPRAPCDIVNLFQVLLDVRPGSHAALSRDVNQTMLAKTDFCLMSIIFLSVYYAPYQNSKSATLFFACFAHSKRIIALLF